MNSSSLLTSYMFPETSIKSKKPEKQRDLKRIYLLRSDQFVHLSFLCLRMKLEHPILHRSKLPSFSRLMIEDLMRERSNSY